MKTIAQAMKYAMSLVCLAAPALAGCVAGDPEPGAMLEEQPVFITAVHMNEDGTQEVRSMQWSRAELRRALRERIRIAEANGVVIDPAEVGLPDDDEEAAIEGAEEVGEAAQAIISVDPACVTDSLLFTDNGSWGDSSHMLCLTGTGTGWMGAYGWDGPYYGGTHKPVAIWTGKYKVQFSCDSACGGGPFAPYQFYSAPYYGTWEGFTRFP